MASSILTLKMQCVRLSKIVGLSRMELQVLKWKCPVVRIGCEWKMMLTELVATDDWTTRCLRVPLSRA